MSGGFDVGSILAHLQLDGSQFRAAIASNAKDLAPLKTSIESVGKSIAHWGIMAAGAAAAIGAAFGAIIVKTANAGDEINDMAKRTGIATEQLSGYKLAAEKAGSSLGGLAIGLRGLANSMQAGAVAGTEQAKMFDALGISIVDGKGKLLPLNDVLLGTAERFSRMEDGAEKAALAQDIFGRSGLELIPLLNQGADGLREEAEMAKKLGLVFSTEAAAGADAFNDAMADLKGALTGIRNDIGIALIPVARQFVEGLSSGLVVLRGEIAKFTASGKLGEWAAAVARAFVTSFKVMVMAVEGLAEAVQFVQGIVFKAGELIVGRLLIWSTQLFGIVSAISSVVPGLKGVQKEIAGVVLNLAAIGTEYRALADQKFEGATDIAVGFDALYKALDIVSASFGKMTAKAAENAETLATVVAPAAAIAAGELHKLVLVESELPPGKTMPNLEGFSGAIKDTAEKVESVWDGFVDNLQWKWESAIGNLLSGANSLKDGLKGIFKAIGQAFIELVSKVIARALAGVVADILELVGIIKGGAAGGIGNILGGLMNSSSAAVQPLMIPGGGLVVAPSAVGFAGVIDTAAAGGILAGMSGTAVLGAVGFAAVWLGTLFGRLFGTSAADKWEAEFTKQMKQKYGTNWESYMRHDVTKSSLKDTTPSPGAVVEHGPARNISGGGTAQPKGDMIVNFHVSTLDADSFDRVVRTKIMPKIRDAAYRREFLIPISAVGGA